MSDSQIKVNKPALTLATVKMNSIAAPVENSKGAGGIVMRMSQGDTADAINDAYRALYEVEKGLISVIKTTKDLLISARDQFTETDEAAAGNIRSIS